MMRGITVRQPHAWLIGESLKPVENRGHAAIVGQARKMLGERIAVHVSAWWQETEFHNAIASAVAALGQLHPYPGSDALRMQCGRIIGTTQIVRIIEHGDGDPLNEHPLRTRDRYALVLENVRKLGRPTRAKGALGLWALTADQERAIREQETA